MVQSTCNEKVLVKKSDLFSSITRNKDSLCRRNWSVFNIAVLQTLGTLLQSQS